MLLSWIQIRKINKEKIIIEVEIQMLVERLYCVDRDQCLTIIFC